MADEFSGAPCAANGLAAQEDRYDLGLNQTSS
jgi:hypothetical protein